MRGGCCWPALRAEGLEGRWPEGRRPEGPRGPMAWLRPLRAWGSRAAGLRCQHSAARDIAHSAAARQRSEEMIRARSLCQ